MSDECGCYTKAYSSFHPAMRTVTQLCIAIAITFAVDAHAAAMPEDFKGLAASDIAALCSLQMTKMAAVAFRYDGQTPAGDLDARISEFFELREVWRRRIGASRESQLDYWTPAVASQSAAAFEAQGAYCVTTGIVHWQRLSVAEGKQIIAVAATQRTSVLDAWRAAAGQSAKTAKPAARS